MTDLAPPRTGLWQNRAFLNLWAAQAVSAVGSRITRTALPIIAIQLLNASVGAVAILNALSLLPSVVVGLFAGGFVDRRRKRSIMIAADLARAVLLLSLPFAGYAGLLTLPHLIFVGALNVALTTLFDMADRSLLAEIAPKEELLDGNAKLETTNSIAETAGPALAGVLIEALTAPIAIIADALTYLWSAVFLRRIHVAEHPAPAAPSADEVASGIRAGFRVCLAHPLIGPTLKAESFRQFFNGFYFALYMILVLRHLGLSAATIGAIIGVGGIGAMIGASFAAPMRAALGAGPSLLVAFLGCRPRCCLCRLPSSKARPPYCSSAFSSWLGMHS